MAVGWNCVPAPARQPRSGCSCPNLPPRGRALRGLPVGKSLAHLLRGHLLRPLGVRNSGPMLSLWMGTAIVGRYVLIGPVGYGGVSVVYQAIDTFRGSRTAIKLLSPAFADDDYARQRVRQEALITTRLRHPSVPQIYDFGDAQLPDGRVVPYVAMELLSGAMLAGRLAGGALPWPEAVRVTATIADVLAIAHRRGVVHRDLTPANIMMTDSGPKIIDFGEAITIEATSALAAEQPLPTRRVRTAA